MTLVFDFFLKIRDSFTFKGYIKQKHDSSVFLVLVFQNDCFPAICFSLSCLYKVFFVFD